MSRNTRIQVVLAIALIVIGNIVVGVGAQISCYGAFEAFDGSGEGLTSTFVDMNRSIEFWNRVNTFVNVTGFVYLLGLLTVWFIGPKEEAEPAGTSVQ